MTRCDPSKVQFVKANLVWPVSVVNGITDPIASVEVAHSLLRNRGTENYIVGPFWPRRPTPVEYERLQGLPDNWTKAAYSRWNAENCPDEPRYKAVGNSMTVPVVKWIFRRLEAAWPRK